MIEPRSAASAWRHLVRALRLRCPSCGEKPLFAPWYKVRRPRDWMTPLDGCPKCGYPYEREPGYFLMSIWAVNYGFGSIVGLILYAVLEWKYDLPVWQLIAAVIAPVIIFNIVFSRHAKALFLAFDLFFDPHRRDRGDDGGNKPSTPPPTNGGAPRSEPVLPAAPGTHMH